MTHQDSRGITAPQGFRAAGHPLRHQETGIARPGAGRLRSKRAHRRRLHKESGGRRAGDSRPSASASVVSDGRSSSTAETPTPAPDAKEWRRHSDTAALVARALQIPIHEVFIGSTGVIGRALPVERIVKALPALFKQSQQPWRGKCGSRHHDDRPETEVGGPTETHQRPPRDHRRHGQGIRHDPSRHGHHARLPHDGRGHHAGRSATSAHASRRMNRSTASRSTAIPARTIRSSVWPTVWPGIA